MKENKPKILVIVGPTASGKTSLSINLAKKFNGEVISADSRQVYKGLDIGTGKVTPEEMDGVPHHLIDVADPNDTYTVYDYVRDAQIAINDIISRGKLPIIVGGTFLYVDALLGRVSTPEVPPNEALRSELEEMTLEALLKRLETLDPERAKTIDTQNKRRLIRAIEIATALGSVPVMKTVELYDVCILGISLSKEQLKQNIHERLVTRLHNGMIEEVERLHRNGLPFLRLTELGIEYKYIPEYLEQKISEAELHSYIETKSVQYAKRQMTWLKRDKTIVWVTPEESLRIGATVTQFLQ